MFQEIKNFAITLCEMTNNSLEEFINNHCGELPFFLGFVASSCYVLYDTQDKRIAAVTLVILDRNGLVIEVDPIAGNVIGKVADEIVGSTEMKREAADTLFNCIHKLWNMRMSDESLVTVGGDNRCVAADLLA